MPTNNEDKGSDEKNEEESKKDNNEAQNNNVTSGHMENGHSVNDDVVFLAPNVFNFDKNRNVPKLIHEGWC